MKLGEILETYRKAKGLSVRALAKQIGCEHTGLHRLLRREYASLDSHTLLQIVNWSVEVRK